MGAKRKMKKAEARAAKLRESLASVRAELARSEKKLRKCKEAAARREAEFAAQQAADDTHRPSQSTRERASVPDKTWTVAQLRAEARARGMSGMSSKAKAELLAALS